MARKAKRKGLGEKEILLITLIVIFFFFIFGGFGMMSMGYMPHMYFMGGYLGYGFFGPVLMILYFVALALLVYWLVKQISKS